MFVHAVTMKILEHFGRKRGGMLYENEWAGRLKYLHGVKWPGLHLCHDIAMTQPCLPLL
jgi:hypothetical protein